MNQAPATLREDSGFDVNRLASGNRPEILPRMRFRQHFPLKSQALYPYCPLPELTNTGTDEAGAFLDSSHKNHMAVGESEGFFDSHLPFQTHVPVDTVLSDFNMRQESPPPQCIVGYKP
uniref:hypothetical protein n=1 Tax=Corallococcus coralloides TaxID=184914 RepID=UPI000FFE5F1C|nr:hypothetical protein [Corallococcus coralloides]